MVDFGNKLKTLRVGNNMTQRELSVRTSVSKSIISSYESGNRYPSYDVLIKLARIFRVSTDFLLGVEKKRSIDVSDLNSNEIEAIDKLIDVFRENRMKK